MPFVCIGHSQTKKVQELPEVQITAKSNSDDLQMPEKQTTPRGPKLDLPGRFSGDFRTHKLEKIVAGGKGKKKVPCKTV